MDKDLSPDKEFEKIILCHVTEKSDEDSASENIKFKKRGRVIVSDQESLDLTCNENFIGDIDDGDGVSLNSLEDSPKQKKKREKKSASKKKQKIREPKIQRAPRDPDIIELSRSRTPRRSRRLNDPQKPAPTYNEDILHMQEKFQPRSDVPTSIKKIKKIFEKSDTVIKNKVNFCQPIFDKRPKQVNFEDEEEK